MIALFLASALMLPANDQGTARALLNRSPRVVDKEDVTTIKAEFWVDERGKAVSCKLLQFEGSRDVANRLCRRSKGIRFVPARDQNGAPIHAVLVTTLSAFPEGFQYLVDIQKKVLKNELETTKISVEVSGESDTLSLRQFVTLTVEIDENGTQAACEASTGAPVELAEIACQQSAGFDHEVRTDKEGEAVSYVRAVTVEFLTNEQP